AILILLGTRVDMWQIGGARTDDDRTGLMVVVNGALRNPALAAVFIAGFLILMSAPAIGLKTGPPSPEQLPQDNQVRLDTEKLAEVMGPGWDAPFTIVVAAENGPITAPQRFDRLVAWQDRIARDPAVQAVVGPSEVAERTEPLSGIGPALLDPETGPLADLTALGRQLGRASGGVAQLRQGLADASYGAGLLGSGADQAENGAMALANGLAQAEDGGTQAVDALERFADGARLLARGQEQAVLGVLALKLNLGSLRANLRNNATRSQRALARQIRAEAERMPELEAAATDAEDEADEAREALEGMTTGRTDPNFDPSLEAVNDALAALTGTDPETGEPYREGEEAYAGYEGLPEELAASHERLLAMADEADSVVVYLETIESGLGRLADGATRLQEGTVQLQQGAERLAEGAEQLVDAAGQLSGGIEQLASGALRLAEGVGLLEGGAGELASGLMGGYDQSAPLQDGLSRASVQVTSGARDARRQVNQLNEASPGLFDSGHFVLSALDGAPPEDRELIDQVVDVGGSGQAASIFVIPTATFNTPESVALDERLDEIADEIAAETDTVAGVAGGAAELNDYGRITSERIPFVIAAIALATFLVLIVVLRALLLAAITVLLNLLAVAVAFGVLTLMFEFPPDWPLGGRTYVDAVGATAIFGVVFGLSIDYAVFLLARMREQYDLHGDHREAIRFGLARTARVITGAAAIMMAVFVAFAGAPIATVSQLGIGLTVAVLLDATVIRIILLPALMLLFGERVWWLPGPLERRLPRLDA
ncbi:MAG TPA: MMPL family transporter, partial [Solirubrobacterales bacterium]|nr:MMPL family transporter [Solirubrobacterales bacterium]